MTLSIISSNLQQKLPYYLSITQTARLWNTISSWNVTVGLNLTCVKHHSSFVGSKTQHRTSVGRPILTIVSRSQTKPYIVQQTEKELTASWYQFKFSNTNIVGEFWWIMPINLTDRFKCSSREKVARMSIDAHIFECSSISILYIRKTTKMHCSVAGEWQSNNFVILFQRVSCWTQIRFVLVWKVWSGTMTSSLVLLCLHGVGPSLFTEAERWLRRLLVDWSSSDNGVITRSWPWPWMFLRSGHWTGATCLVSRSVWCE